MKISNFWDGFADFQIPGLDRTVLSPSYDFVCLLWINYELECEAY